MGTFLGWSIKPPSNLTKFVILAVVSISLVTIDAEHRHETHTVRGLLDRALYPVQAVSTLPTTFTQGIRDYLRSNATLRQENHRLSQANLLLRAKLTRFDALKAQAARLNKLFKAPPIPGYRETIARVLAVSAGPFTRRLTLDEGAHQGITIGQPVIDAHGIVGQIVKVGPDTSQVMMITDPNSGVPVISTRDGLRAIVFGTGSMTHLKVPYLTITADIRPGDILVSSGLGGIFPPGYPVARVTRVVSNPNLAFLKVVAEPLARLDHYTEVVLLWPRHTNPTVKESHGQ